MTMSVRSGYHIGPARREHLPLLAVVEKAAAAIFPPGSIPEAIRGESCPTPVLEEALRAGNLFTAHDGTGWLVGFALLTCEGDGTVAYLAEMDVLPGHMRRGIGSALIVRVASRARELGYAHLYLTTFAKVPWNAPLYAKRGFDPIAGHEIPAAIAAHLADERARGLEGRVAMRMIL